MRISVAKTHSGFGNKEISVETDCVIGLIRTLLICGIFSCQTSSAYRELSKQTRSKEKNASEVRFILQYPVCASSFFYSCQPAFLFFDFRRTLDSKSAHEKTLLQTSKRSYYCGSGDIDQVSPSVSLQLAPSSCPHTTWMRPTS